LIGPETLYRTNVGVEGAREAFEDVFNARAELQSIYAKSFLDIDNFETLFGAVEMAAIIGKLGQRDAESITRLRENVVTLIVRTLEHCIRFPVADRRIKPPEPYDRFVGMLYETMEFLRSRPDVSFITFNYDLALDYALHYMGTLGGFSYHLSDEANSQTMPLLKLHGSINWGVCRRCNSIVARDISGLPYGDPLWLMHESVILDLGTNINRQQHCGEPLNRVPVIVPPTWSKGSQYKDLGRVWAKAAAELAAAENIFVVGYSMPETDSFFRYLYALGSQSTTKLRRFWVFDPDPDKSVEQRMKTLIGQESKGMRSISLGTHSRML